MPQHTSAAPLPRRVYFGAADKQHLAKKPVSGGPSVHELEVGRRGKLAANVSARADDVAAAIKSLRAFDFTGFTEDALDHLQATVEDLNRAHRILVDDVTESIGRYRDRALNEQILAEATDRRAADQDAPGTVEVDILPDLGGLRVLRTDANADGIFVTAAAVSNIPAASAPGMSIAAPKPGPRA